MGGQAAAVMMGGPAGAAAGATRRANDGSDVDRASLRVQAQAHLRELVGDPAAELREDQWTAIEALVVDHRRALVVQLVLEARMLPAVQSVREAT